MPHDIEITKSHDLINLDAMYAAKAAISQGDIHPKDSFIKAFTVGYQLGTLQVICSSEILDSTVSTNEFLLLCIKAMKAEQGGG